MKELLRKKSVRISLLLIILIVVVAVVGINVQSAQRREEYNGHIAAAEKYLTELEYEQAIAEYNMALEIEPNAAGALDGLENTYLAYAQSVADAGDYERAIAILEEGYGQTGRESLRTKLEELRNQIVEFPFELTDITFMGYDLFGDHYEELCGAVQCPVPQDTLSMGSVENEYGHVHSELGMLEDGAESKSLSFFPAVETDNVWNRLYMSWHESGPNNDGLQGRGMYILSNPLGEAKVLEAVKVPVMPENTYEDWCRIMCVEEIKEKAWMVSDIGGGREWYALWKGGFVLYSETTGFEAVSIAFIGPTQQYIIDKYGDYVGYSELDGVNEFEFQRIAEMKK